MHSLEKAKGDNDVLSVKQLVSMGKSEEDILSHLRQYSYDKFVLKIVNFQVCNIKDLNQFFHNENLIQLFWNE